jgi:hypothetical protein
MISDADTAAILEKAEGCMGEECSIDEVNDLLGLLKKTESDLEVRLKTIVKLVKDLEHLNQKGERETDDVRAFVKDMMRVFSTDVSVILLCM